jgi:purine-binding chemotaxis protein CheW
MSMSTATQSSTTGKAAQPLDGTNHEKFLTFCLGHEEYGLPILVVREIICLMEVTPLPRTPDYVKGVINLRGKIIPVIELRTRFGLSKVPYTQETCIIVVEVSAIEGGASAFHLGVIVDGVREVVSIGRGSIEPPPAMGGSVPLSAIQGMGKVNGKVVILLNIDAVGATPEVGNLTTSESAQSTNTPPRQRAAA